MPDFERNKLTTLIVLVCRSCLLLLLLLLFNEVFTVALQIDEFVRLKLWVPDHLVVLRKIDSCGGSYHYWFDGHVLLLIDRLNIWSAQAHCCHWLALGSSTEESLRSEVFVLGGWVSFDIIGLEWKVLCTLRCLGPLALHSPELYLGWMAGEAWVGVCSLRLRLILKLIAIELIKDASCSRELTKRDLVMPFLNETAKSLSWLGRRIVALPRLTLRRAPNIFIVRASLMQGLALLAYMV